MKLDKNQLIGIGLMILIFIGFNYFIKPSDEENKENKETTKTEVSETPSVDKNQASTTPTIVEDSITKVDSTTLAIPVKEIIVKNNDLEFKISSLGAQFYDFKLDDYLLHDSTAHVVLLQKERTTRNVYLGETNISAENVRYTTNAKDSVIVTSESQTITLTANVNGKTVIQKIVVPVDGYLIEHSISGTALESYADLKFEFNHTLPVTERRHHKHEGFKFSRTYAKVHYLTKEGDFDDIGAGANEDEKIEESLKWFSFKQRFFTIGIAPDGGVQSNARLRSSYVDSEDDLNYVKKMKANYLVDLNNTKVYNSKIYVGPNDFYTLEETGLDNFGKNVDMGWLIFGVINKYMILPVFDWLADSIHNFGLVILLLVLIIKTVLFPIAYKSYSSMAKMKALKPDLDKLKEKHGDDQQAYGQAQMGLYRQAGVNPVAGCLPQLLQLPFLFALFRFFPNAIQLRQESFLWAKDLSTYDALISWDAWIPFIGIHISIFTILMTTTTLINSWYNSQFNSTASTANNPMGNQMKYLMYFMPLIFFFVLNDYPSGLTFYYFISTLFTILQQFVANKLIDPDKIRAKIDDNKTKSTSGTAKKSRFQQRLEAAMEAQEASKKKKK